MVQVQQRPKFNLEAQCQDKTREEKKHTRECIPQCVRHFTNASGLSPTLVNVTF